MNHIFIKNFLGLDHLDSKNETLLEILSIYVLSICKQKTSDIDLDSTKLRDKLNNKYLSEISTSPSLPTRVSNAENPKKTCSQLSMVWVKEFDGTRERLVAKWVKEV